MDMAESVSEKIAETVNRVYGKLDRYAPKNELTPQMYKGLTEDKLYILVDKYGKQKVYNWLLENQKNG